MRVLLIFFVVMYFLSSGEAKRKWKFEGDFEFADEDNLKGAKTGEKKKWIHDPSSDLCKPLKCKKKEICLLEDTFTAVCVSRKELKKNGDIVVPKPISKKGADKSDDLAEDDDDVFYDSEDDIEDYSKEDLGDPLVCSPCPVVKPVFLCGSDNKTYSSLCRLNYHNCIHHTTIKVACKGFCACKEIDLRYKKKQRQSERMNNFISKYKATVNKGDSQKEPSKMDNYKNEGYSFVPQDIKYDNKHYKYMKYTKYNKDNMLYSKDKEILFNEVTDLKTQNNFVDRVDPALPITKQCSPIALQAMGNRLLDWFSVVMADSSKRRKPRSKSRAYFPPSCKWEVRWMFQHLDVTADSRLSLDELYDLEHDQSEICLKPFLQQCDIDQDTYVTPSEWCKCFLRSERPCAAVRHKITTDLLGVYVPDCDNQGYYNSEQCHSAIGMCWCVDKHGVEFANTRTHGKPNCSLLLKHKDLSSQTQDGNGIGESSDDEDEDSDQDIEGSADRPAEY